MDIAIFLTALAVGVLAVTALSARIDLPAPLVLIAAGIGISYLPSMPEVHLEPEVVLLGFLPPLLYATAIQTSLVDVNANRRSILLLSVDGDVSQNLIRKIDALPSVRRVTSLKF